MSNVRGSAEAPLLSAVIGWFNFYSVPFREDVANVLCDRAIDLYNRGASEQDIADHLIANFVGVVWTKANSPSSMTVH